MKWKTKETRSGLLFIPLIFGFPDCEPAHAKSRMLKFSSLDYWRHLGDYQAHKLEDYQADKLRVYQARKLGVSCCHSRIKIGFLRYSNISQAVEDL